MLIANLTGAVNKGGQNTEEVFLSIDGKIVDFTIMGITLSDGAKILEVVTLEKTEKLEADSQVPSQEQEAQDAVGGTETTNIKDISNTSQEDLDAAEAESKKETAKNKTSKHEKH